MRRKTLIGGFLAAVVACLWVTLRPSGRFT
jgi:hypothetical protein